MYRLYWKWMHKKPIFGRLRGNDRKECLSLASSLVEILAETCAFHDHNVSQ